MGNFSTQGRKPKPGGSGETRQPKGSGAKHVYDGLREEILNHSLRPGTMLDESEISLRFGVSRSPVREAIIRLAAEGLVDTLRNRGAMVAQFDMEDLPSYFDALKVAYRMTARGAAANATEADVAALEDIQARLETVLSEGRHTEMIALNQAFHRRIAAAAGNRWVADWQQTLLDQGQRVLRAHATHFGGIVPSRQLDCHRRIIAAVKARDADAADDAAAGDSELVRDQMIAFMVKGRAGDLRLG